MFILYRSALTVLLPIALLIAVVSWSNRSTPVAPQAAHAAPESHVERVAQTGPARTQGG